MSIRYYRKEFPNVGDILFVKITEIADGDNGVYAQTPEYPNIRVFILPTEINRKKVNVGKFFSQDKFYPVLVLSINTTKKLVDVSYSKVPEKDREGHLARFSLYQKIYKLGLNASEIYADFMKSDSSEAKKYIFNVTVWDVLQEDNLNKITSEYFISLLEDPSKFFSSKDELPSSYVERFVQDLKKKIKISDIVLASEIVLLSLQAGAVEKIKTVLKSNIDPNIHIEYIASPRYKIIAQASDKTIAELLIKDAIKTIKNNCTENGVTFVKHSDISVLKEKSYSH